MNQYKRFILDTRAHTYIRQVLENGRTLSHNLLTYLEFNRGQVSTFLPPFTPDNQIYEFTQGGKFPSPPPSKTIIIEKGRAVPVPGVRWRIASEITQFIRTRMIDVCMIENVLARASDPVIRQYESPLLTFGDDVYHLIRENRRTRPIDEALVATAIKEASSSHRLLAALAAVAEFPTPLPSLPEPVEAETLRTLAENTNVLYVGAYDGEGYLRWSLLD